jgi:hypothetical protein
VPLSLPLRMAGGPLTQIMKCLSMISPAGRGLAILLNSIKLIRG